MKVFKYDMQFIFLCFVCLVTKFSIVVYPPISVILLMASLYLLNSTIIPNMKLWIVKVPNVRLLMTFSLLLSFLISSIYQYIIVTDEGTFISYLPLVICFFYVERKII